MTTTKRKQERLEFMYAPPMAANKEKEEEEYALGKPVEAIDAKEKEKQTNVPNSMFEEGQVKSQNEMWQRMTHDPLVSIKLQEEQALRRIRENPVRMEAIRSQIQELEDRKRKRRSHGRDHKDSHRRRSRSRSRSPDSKHEHRHDRRGRSKDERHREARTHQSSRRSPSIKEEARRERRESRYGRDGRSRSPSYDRRKDRYDSRHDRAGEPRHFSSSRGLSHPRHTEEEQERRRPPCHHPDVSGGHHEVRIVQDSASSQRSHRYGLQIPEGHVQLHGNADGSRMPSRTTSSVPSTSGRAVSNRGRSDPKRSGVEASRRVSGKLSEEEKARRLAEMSQNADTHEGLKRARLAEAAEADRRDVYSSVEQVNRHLQHHTSKATFLSEAGRSLFSTEGTHTLEDQLSRRRRGP